jgi:hypothetical protein
MSTISASTTTNTGYVVTSDTTGTLVIKTGATPTTAVTVSSAQVFDFANTPTVAGSPIGASPGGSTTQVQYNNAGAFAGSANMTFSGTALTLTNDASISGLTVGKGGGAVSSNTAVGASALVANTSGVNSTAIGYQALKSNTSGFSHTAVGYNALSTTVTGIGSTAVGQSAGAANTSGVVEAFGVSALTSNTTGVANQAFGSGGGGLNAPLEKNTTGSNNQAYGRGALGTNTTGGSNVAVGSAALYSLTTKTHNVAIGYQALYNTNEDANIAVGSFSLKTNTTGYYNTAMGYDSLSALTTGNQNTAVGMQAGVAMTSGGSNTLIGKDTGASLTTGSVNTFVGRYAGQTFTTGSYNTHIGYATVASGAGQGSEIVISGGPSGATGKGGDTGFITPNGGPMFQGNNAGSWSTVSDRRLKKNIIDNNEGLNKIAQIQVRNFEYRIEEEITDLPKEQVIKKTGVQFGVIAQELQAVLPDCVTEQSTGVLTIDSDNLTWYLINAVKELKAELDALKAKVA